MVSYYFHSWTTSWNKDWCLFCGCIIVICLNNFTLKNWLHLITTHHHPSYILPHIPKMMFWVSHCSEKTKTHAWCRYFSTLWCKSPNEALPELPQRIQFYSRNWLCHWKKRSHENTSQANVTHKGITHWTHLGKEGSSTSGSCEGQSSAELTEAVQQRPAAYRWSGFSMVVCFKGRVKAAVYHMYFWGKGKGRNMLLQIFMSRWCFQLWGDLCAEEKMDWSSRLGCEARETARRLISRVI